MSSESSESSLNTCISDSDPQGKVDDERSNSAMNDDTVEQEERDTRIDDAPEGAKKNPYINFLRDYRIRFGNRFKGSALVQRAALHWQNMTQNQRSLYAPGVYQYERMTMTMESSDDDEMGDSDISSNSNGNVASDNDTFQQVNPSIPQLTKVDGDMCCPIKKKKKSGCKPKKPRRKAGCSKPKPRLRKPKPKRKQKCKPKAKKAKPRCPKPKVRSGKPKSRPKKSKPRCRPKPAC